MSFSYPIFLNLTGQKCLVVGGGTVAERKTRSLLECNADVLVVSPELNEWLTAAFNEGLIKVTKRNYKSSDITDMFIVIGATGQHEINEMISQDCREKNILVNIVDEPQHCNFIVPATVKRGRLKIAVSTDGTSPMLARKLRKDLEMNYGPEYDEFLELMSTIRQHVFEKEPDEEKRKKIYYDLVYSDLLELLREKKHDVVKERVTHVLGSGWFKP